MSAGRYRLRKEIAAFRWDVTEDDAYALFDFLADVGCQFQDDGSVRIVAEDDTIDVQPSEWIVRQGLGSYVVLSNESFERQFEAVAP